MRCAFLSVKNHPRWLVYALDRETRKVVAFKVGRRTNRTLSVVLQSLFLSKAKMIYTDKLKKYSYLISWKYTVPFSVLPTISSGTILHFVSTWNDWTENDLLQPQFISANSYHKDLPVGIATVRNHNTATTIPNPCLHYLSGMRWDKAGVFFILWISESTSVSISCFTLR